MLKVELFFPENHSLKEKRYYIRSIKDRIRSSLNVSVAEVDHQELWQRSSLAFACVAYEKHMAEDTLNGVKKLLERHYPEFLLELRMEFMRL